MKNIRKIFGAVTVLSLTAITGVNAVACSCTFPFASSPRIEMSDKLLTQLGIYDQEGKPQIKVAIRLDPDENEIPDWRPINGPENVDASYLLDQDNKAKDAEAKKLLTKYFKLTADENEAFNKKEAEKIKLQYQYDKLFFGESELNLIATPDEHDWAVASGKLSFKWILNEGEKEAKTLAHGTFDILGDRNKGVVNDALTLKEGTFTINDFKREKTPLKEFKIGGKVDAIAKDLDITNFVVLDLENNRYAHYFFSLNFFGPLSKMKFKFIITEVNASEATFKAGDNLTLQLSYDDILLNHQYTLELPQE